MNVFFIRDWEHYRRGTVASVDRGLALALVGANRAVAADPETVRALDTDSQPTVGAPSGGALSDVARSMVGQRFTTPAYTTVMKVSWKK